MQLLIEGAFHNFRHEIQFTNNYKKKSALQTRGVWFESSGHFEDLMKNTIQLHHGNYGIQFLNSAITNDLTLCKVL